MAQIKIKKKTFEIEEIRESALSAAEQIQETLDVILDIFEEKGHITFSDYMSKIGPPLKESKEKAKSASIGINEIIIACL